MSISHVNDSSIDHVIITWDNRPGMFLTQIQSNISDPEHERIVRSFLSIGNWDDVLFMAEGVYERKSRSMDLRAFAYPVDNLKTTDPDYAIFVFEGVNICDGAFEYINLSEPAFTRLMAQLFNVLISGATRTQLPVIHEDWWERFVELAGDISQRAQHLT